MVDREGRGAILGRVFVVALDRRPDGVLAGGEIKELEAAVGGQRDGLRIAGDFGFDADVHAFRYGLVVADQDGAPDTEVRFGDQVRDLQVLTVALGLDLDRAGGADAGDGVHGGGDV